MSEFVGTFKVQGRGGLDIVVFDDALVRAWTGLKSLASVMTRSGSPVVGGVLGGAVGGAVLAGATRFLDKGQAAPVLLETPEQVAAGDKNNRLIWAEDVDSAVLSRGRGLQTAGRSLVLRVGGGEQLKWAWTTNLNKDDHVVRLLSAAVGEVLEVRLRGY